MRQALRQTTQSSQRYNMLSTMSAPSVSVQNCISPDLQDEKYYNLRARFSESPVQTRSSLSPAQMDRLNQYAHKLRKPDYEVIRRLESIAVKHHSSVPMVLSSLKGQELAGFRVKLSNSEKKYLKEAL